MNIIPLDDAGIVRGIAYDSSSKELLVLTFLGNFIFKDVSHQLFVEFLHAPMKEQFYNNRIKGHYIASRIQKSR